MQSKELHISIWCDLDTGIIWMGFWPHDGYGLIPADPWTMADYKAAPVHMEMDPGEALRLSHDLAAMATLAAHAQGHNCEEGHGRTSPRPPDSGGPPKAGGPPEVERGASGPAMTSEELERLWQGTMEKKSDDDRDV